MPGGGFFIVRQGGRFRTFLRIFPDRELPEKPAGFLIPQMEGKDRKAAKGGKK